MFALQVINKYGDLYGAERIAELLGLDKSALDFNPTEETVIKDASLLSWSGTTSRTHPHYYRKHSADACLTDCVIA